MYSKNWHGKNCTERLYNVTSITYLSLIGRIWYFWIDRKNIIYISRCEITTALCLADSKIYQNKEEKPIQFGGKIKIRPHKEFLLVNENKLVSLILKPPGVWFYSLLLPCSFPLFADFLSCHEVFLMSILDDECVDESEREDAASALTNPPRLLWLQIAGRKENNCDDSAPNQCCAFLQ